MLYAEEMYQCTDSDGNVTITDTPCLIKTKSKTLESDKDEEMIWDAGLWGDETSEFVDLKDILNWNDDSCFLFSSKIYNIWSNKESHAFKTHRNNKFLYVYVIISEEGGISIVSSRGHFDEQFPNGKLGLRVDNQPFVPIDIKEGRGHSQYLFTYILDDKNSELLEQMKSGYMLTGNISFSTYYGAPCFFKIPLAQFNDAFNKFEKCKNGR